MFKHDNNGRGMNMKDSLWIKRVLVVCLALIKVFGCARRSCADCTCRGSRIICRAAGS